MAGESVVFELQVEKKVLEQVFNENQHLKDSYNKLVEKEGTIKDFSKQIEKLEQENGNLRKINKMLNEENDKLKRHLRELEEKHRIDQEKNRLCELDTNENKLLKIKLQKVETEKSKIVEQYEEETKILDGILRDKSKTDMIQNQLEKTMENLMKLSEELKETKIQLLNLDNENKQLDQDKLNLELQLKNLSRHLRLEEERNKSNDLAQVECKLLKLKLHTIENEKQYLLDDFERERKIISKQNKPRVAKLEENISLLRKWIEKEARERRPRDTDEVKALKAQIHILENDKIDLIEGFELERKVFQKILKANGNYDLP